MSQILVALMVMLVLGWLVAIADITFDWKKPEPGASFFVGLSVAAFVCLTIGAYARHPGIFLAGGGFAVGIAVILGFIPSWRPAGKLTAGLVLIALSLVAVILPQTEWFYPLLMFCGAAMSYGSTLASEVLLCCYNPSPDRA